MSNDTDTFVRSLRIISQMRETGLQELWVKFGSVKHWRRVPADKVGVGLNRRTVKVHVFSGDDEHGSVTCDPQMCPADFAESNQLTKEDMQKAEVGWRKVQARILYFRRASSSTPKTLETLPTHITCHSWSYSES